MKILVLGGTRFVGSHLVEGALARGWEVTLFNRGKSAPQRFPGVETLIGDRDGGLDALGERTWDAVVDTSGYVPRLVAQSAERLAERVGRYLFVSTVSVYRDFAHAGMDESAPLAEPPAPEVEQVNGETYGGLKVACERVVTARYGPRALIVRPGLIVGPDDPTDRFTYWPHRVAEGGEVLVPGTPERPIQAIDARDLAEWMLRALEAGLSGPYNATGPETTMGALIEACCALAERDATPVWVGDAFVEHEGIDLPFWSEPGQRGILQIDSGRAIAAGLRFRPLADTARDTLAWDRARGGEPLRVGLSPERERELLAAWHAAQPAT